jgi:AsmA protein
VRVFKWIAIAVGGLLGLLVVAVLAIVWFVDANRFKPEIAARVHAATGRELALPGDIKLGFYPWLALETGKGSFGNAPGFEPEPMASWESLRIGAKLMPLLHGEFEIGAVAITSADIHLERRADGKGNWEGLGGAEAARPDPAAAPMQLRIDGVSIKNSRLRFTDAAAARELRIEDLGLTTDDIEPDEPLTDTALEGRLFMAGFAADGVPFRFVAPEIRYDAPEQSLVVPGLSASVGELALDGSLQATLGEPLAARGSIDTRTFDLKRLLAMFGIEPPKTTDPAVFDAVELDANVEFNAGAVRVEQVTLIVDATRFTGRFARTAGADAVGEFTLRGDRLDVGRYIPPPDPKSEPFKLPTAALRALRFRGVLEVEELKYDDILAKGATLRLVLDEQGFHGAKPE